MFDEHTCCCFGPTLLNKPYLVEIELDKEPFACVKSGDWAKAGLEHLPDEVVHLDWIRVVRYLSRNKKVL